MASSARIDELKKKFDENPRRYFAPLANEFRKMGELEQAIMICEEFLPQQPGHMSGHIVYGQALFESERLPEARTVFETALGLDPENLIALRHLGDIARRQGDVGGARQWYARVLDADPRNEEIQALIASLEGEGTEPPSAATEPERPVGAARGEEGAARPFSDSPDAQGAPEAESVEFTVDTTLPTGMPAVPATPPETGAGAELDVLGLESHVEHAPAPAAAHEAAHGFQSTAFAPESAEAPDAGDALDLEASFEAGIGAFAGGDSPVTPVPGLEETHSASGAPAGAAEPAGELSLLDDAREAPVQLDDGGALPPHGDLLESASPAGNAWAPIVESDARERLGAPEAEYVAAAEFGMLEATSPEAASPLLDGEGMDAPPAELPPAVIAAESELLELDADFGATEPAAPQPEYAGALPELGAEPVVGEPLAGEAAEHPEQGGSEMPAAARPFVTETMAELYLAQGLHDRAVEVYRQLRDAQPDDERLQRRVAELERAGGAAAEEDRSPNVREYLVRIATRRPGMRAMASTPPSAGDFAPTTPADFGTTESVEAPPDSGPAPAPSAIADGGEHPPAEGGSELPARGRGDAPAPAGSSIDALFGSRPAAATEDSAAAALAQAFGGSVDVPLISGRPARAATGELSLDSVFRDAGGRPPRATQSFSFDQFFSEGATANEAPAPRASQEIVVTGEPAERSADDIEQFNAWLQGLKQR